MSHEFRELDLLRRIFPHINYDAFLKTQGVQDPSKRDFLKKAAAGVGLALGLGYAGEANSQLSESEVRTLQALTTDWEPYITLVEDKFDDNVVPQMFDGNYVLTTRNGNPVGDFTALGWTESGGILTMIGPADATIDIFATDDTHDQIKTMGEFKTVIPGAYGGYGIQIGNNNQSRFLRYIIFQDGTATKLAIFENSNMIHTQPFNTSSSDVRLRVNNDLGAVIGQVDYKIAGTWQDLWEPIGSENQFLMDQKVSSGVVVSYQGGNYRMSRLLIEIPNPEPGPQVPTAGPLTLVALATTVAAAGYNILRKDAVRRE